LIRNLVTLIGQQIVPTAVALLAPLPTIALLAPLPVAAVVAIRVAIVVVAVVAVVAVRVAIVVVAAIAVVAVRVAIVVVAAVAVVAVRVAIVVVVALHRTQCWAIVLRAADGDDLLRAFWLVVGPHQCANGSCSVWGKNRPLELP
jgi:hypothetical protein